MFSTFLSLLFKLLEARYLNLKDNSSAPAVSARVPSLEKNVIVTDAQWILGYRVGQEGSNGWIQGLISWPHSKEPSKWDSPVFNRSLRRPLNWDTAHVCTDTYLFYWPTYTLIVIMNHSGFLMSAVNLSWSQCLSFLETVILLTFSSFLSALN